MNHRTLTKHFYWINALVLNLLALLLSVQENFQHMVFWPIAPLLSVYVLSSLGFYLYQTKKADKYLLPIVLAFGITYWMLSAFFTIIFERFFRMEEHYQLLEIVAFLVSHWYYLIHAILWIAFYLLLFKFLNLASVLAYNQQQLHQLEKELGRSEINSLRKELNPHFLFNAMNSIAMKVRLKENRTAVAMIAALNDLLRLSLKPEKSPFITVREELALLDKYLLIEKERFDDQIMLEMNIANNTLDLKIPELLLQPLVENAFKHGMDLERKNHRITLTTTRSDNDMILTIYNTLSKIGHFNFTHSGTGIPNVVHRLRNYYGLHFKFQSFVDDAGIAFKITIPVNG